MGESVTISLNQLRQRPMFLEGDLIKLAKNSWGISRQRIKTKRMIWRMLKKEYYPYFKVIKVDDKNWMETTLTMKPYNF